MDILGALPVELSIRILKCLTPAESILLRLVSKSYHDLLTSEVVCSSLSRHFIKREYNTAMELNSWRLHYENHVSRRLAYGSGKYWMTELLPCMPFRAFCPETGYFAGVPETARHSVQVLDLNTYPAKYVLPPARTPDSSEIRDVVLLPSFVVVVGRANRGYSWNLETHQVYRFEVPGSYTAISGNGNLIVIALQDSVIVHDVQAEKASAFNCIGDKMRAWEGKALEEADFSGRMFAIPNAEKRAVWIFRELQIRNFLMEPVFVIDSLRLETGRRVSMEEAPSIAGNVKHYMGDGLWQFTRSLPFSFHRGVTQRSINAQVKRLVFDAGTGAWTDEPYPVMFPNWLPKFRHTCFSSPITRSDGLGCFTEEHPYSGVWMLDQEPRDRVTYARPLAPNALAGLEGDIHCLGLCDKFVLLCDVLVNKIVAVRFKGIHDSDR